MSPSTDATARSRRHGPQPSLGRWWAAFTLFLTLLAFPAHAQTFPAFSGYVVDQANLLPPDVEAALAAKLEALEKQTHRQLVVATIPDLQGVPIEDYGYQLGRTWGVGQKETNSGAILLVAPNDRKVRIEVGYGLEPVLTDALSSMIINGQILPRFKAGDMAGGVVAGTDAIIDQLALPDAEAKAKADAAFAAEKRAKDSDGSGAAIGFFVIFFGIILFSLLARSRRGTRGSRFGGDGGVFLWTALNVLEGMSRSGGGSGGGGGGFGGGGGGGFGGGGGGSFGGGGASGGW